VRVLYEALGEAARRVRADEPIQASARSSVTHVIRLDVPRYEVTVQGQGIAVPIATSLAIGFLRVVQVSARDRVAAEIRAVELVRSEWASSPYASSDRSGPPYLTINRIGLLSWWHRLLGAPKGYIFFSEDGVQTQDSS